MRVSEGEPWDSASRAVAENTATVDPLAADTKFYVVDAESAETFRYASDGTSSGVLATGDVFNNPRGVASNRQGTLLWAIDADQTVHVSNASGNFPGRLDLQRVA